MDDMLREMAMSGVDFTSIRNVAVTSIALVCMGPCHATFDDICLSKTRTIDVSEAYWVSLPVLGVWLCAALFRTCPSRGLGTGNQK